ncbi:MAG: hypothetical protein U0105_04545 [Candidatus Obscuribacterales bacterium]
MRRGVGAWLAVLCLLAQAPCFADEEASADVSAVTESTSGASTGSGSAAAYFKSLSGNKTALIAARYKERLNNFRSQIESAISKGWLTGEESEMFRNQVVALTYLENQVSEKGYPKEDLDDMEQRFNEFNRRLSQTMVKGTPKPPPPPAPATTDGGDGSAAAVGAATIPAVKSVPAVVKKPQPQPASKPVAKKPAAKKPAAKKPAAKKPAAKKPTAKKPTAKKPAAKKPAAKKPAAKKPAAKKPAAKKPQG